MPFIEVNHDTCTKCGICVATCGLGLINCQVNDYPSPVEFIETSCIRCGQCVAVCPTGSLTHRVIPVEKCLPVRNDLSVTPEQCEHLLKNRRSIRVYRREAVARYIITRLIDMARYAPSGHNSQCVEWLVIDNRDELIRIKEAVTAWVRWFIVDKPEIAGSMEMDRLLSELESGKDELLHDAPVLIVTHAKANDLMAPAACNIALTYLQIAAESMGLGTCWAGFVQAASGYPAVKEVLALPEGHFNYGSMLVGYAQYTYYRIPTRKPAHITWR